MLNLQKALLQLGFNPNGTDGKFGRGTQNAVKAYQKAFQCRYENACSHARTRWKHEDVQ